jgi:Hydrazine synthase alpha subunit middle domain
VFSRSILACTFLIAVTGPARPANPARQSDDLPPFLFTSAKSYEPLAWMRGADRFSSDVAIFIRDADGRRAFVPNFARSADPAVSFDGKHVLFAGKVHAGEPWQIWEVAADGSAARPVTTGTEDCIRPFYVPEDRVIYARRISGQFVIEAGDRATGKTLTLTRIPGNAIPSGVLHDGRILFEAGYPLGTGSTPEIYTVYSDGSGVESYRCDHGASHHAATETSDGDILFSSPHGIARFTSARAQQVNVSAPAGDYSGGLAETQAAKWLVSWRPAAGSIFRLMLWDRAVSELESALEWRDTNLIQPTFLSARTVPNRHPSGLHDWANANLLCLNAYTSKYQFAAGSIHSVRIYTRDAEGNRKLLGAAPVEKDGSFFVQVPTEQPVQIELADSAGKTLEREAGFFWMRRGEQRGCVGCHAGPETAPENAVPMILLKSTTPADMTGTQTAAGGH